ncbi:rhodanese-like domain-containing protein [Phycicoccus flavus]|uniref:rhodanese-like domain-containing protein n=1 Tax=Phycicoccus flavus TaxID=2502783 RepID=UPI000FEBDDF6|nr:rhodanese-like domain-containing protein [Phycicoccus flavus]NHA68827.1 rhodanese-like domain-containing protein [Phycicoccus flavus]
MSDFPDVPVSDVSDDTTFLDIREQDEWDLGHAPQAVHIPMSELSDRVGELSSFRDADGPLLVTCKSGGRVARVLPWLADQGFEVANLEGGMTAWHEAGRPMEAKNGTPTVA